MNPLSLRDSNLVKESGEPDYFLSEGTVSIPAAQLSRCRRVVLLGVLLRSLCPIQARCRRVKLLVPHVPIKLVAGGSGCSASRVPIDLLQVRAQLTATFVYILFL